MKGFIVLRNCPPHFLGEGMWYEVDFDKHSPEPATYRVPLASATFGPTGSVEPRQSDGATAEVYEAIDPPPSAPPETS